MHRVGISARAVHRAIRRAQGFVFESGDFAVLENELQPVLKALRKGGINIVAIHQHMTMESPRMIFLHYWGKGNAEKIAKTVKEALNLTK